MISKTAATLLAVLFSVTFGAVGAYGSLLWARQHTPSHLNSRTKAILSQAAQGDWRVVVLGDSMVELANVRSVCGKAALNAGLAGARTAQVLPVARELMKMVHPELVVIAVGTNDSRYSDPTPMPTFSQEYRDLIEIAESSGSRVALIDIPPPGSFAKGTKFSPAATAERNRFISQLHLNVGRASSALQGSDGYMLRSFTDDGVHPNAAGYRQWLDEMQRTACS